MIEGFNKFLAMVVRNIKKVVGMVILVVAVGIIFSMAFREGYSFMRADSYTEDTNTGRMITVRVPQDVTVSDIADILVEAGVLENSIEFSIKARLMGSSDFKYGVYYIRENEDVDQIISILKKGDQSNVVTVTVSAGMTVDELAEELQTLDVCQMVYFKKACNSTSFDMPVLREIDTTNGRRYALEGYLLPGTYQIIKDSGSNSVAKVFLDEFDSSFTKAMKQIIEESGFTMDQILTIASVVEAECAVSSDYKIMASMLLNRIRDKRESMQYWNAPSTLLYAQQRYDDSLTSITELDQSYDSPYNTYLYPGFPPGPICNPSMEAINAVLYPEDTDYYFYEIDLNNRNGARHFSKTQAEHDAYLESQH